MGRAQSLLNKFRANNITKALFGLMEGDGMEWNEGEGARGPLFVLFKYGWNGVEVSGPYSISYHSFPSILFPQFGRNGMEWKKTELLKFKITSLASLKPTPPCPFCANLITSSNSYSLPTIAL